MELRQKWINGIIIVCGILCVLITVFLFFSYISK